MKRWAFVISIFILCVLFTEQSAFAKEERRNCFGMLWCTIETEEGVSVDVLFYLYSSEQKGSYSKLAIRPFYSREIDPEEEYLKRSILWPLGHYERKGDQRSAHLLPFYWHGREPGRRYTLLPPLYFDYEKGERSYFHIIPFYGHHRRGKDYDRYYILGPLSIRTHDAQRGLHQWDILYPVFSHRRDNEGKRSWLLPVYFSGTNNQSGLSYRYFLNYGYQEGPEFGLRYFFPIFGSEEEKTRGESRFSLLGLPPISFLRPLPTLALYEHLNAPDRIRDRFFPIYRYVRWLDEDRTEVDALLLYRHDAAPNRVTDRFFPFYRYENDLENQRVRFALIGHRERSLFWVEADGTTTRHHLFPVYSYRDVVQGERHLGLLGYGHFSLFVKERTPTHSSHHLFPVYRFRKNLESGALRLNALLLYEHRSGPQRTTDRFFPFYRYENDLENQAMRFALIGHRELSFLWFEADATTTRHHLFPLYGYRSDEVGYRFSLFGLSPTGDRLTFSLYEHARTDLMTSDRFFPFYSYANNRENGEIRWNVLLLYRHKETGTYTQDALLPIHSYENDKANDSWRFGLLGVPPLTFYEHRVVQDETSDYFFPIYAYRSDLDGTRFSMLGLPPMGGRITFSLYEHTHTALMTNDRFFPFYTYTNNRETGEIRWDALLLYRHKKTESYTKDAFLPFHSYENDRANKIWRFGMLGVPPLTLYEHRVTAEETEDHFFPLYGYWSTADGRDFTILGLPPSMGSLDLAFILDRRNSSGAINRFFPFYRYERDHDALATRFALIGHRELSLLWIEADPATIRHHLFPLYSYLRDSNEETWRLGIVGYGDLSLYRRNRDTNGFSDRLFPFYDYEADGEGRFLSLFGVSKFALYRKEKTSTHLSHRFFPFYRYHQDLERGELRLNALLLYTHRSGPQGTTDRFIPFYRYENDLENQALRLAFIGHRAFSLYWYEADATTRRQHLFPVYSYRNTVEGGERLGVFGIGRFSLFLKEKTPTLSTHHLFPLYRYRKDLQQDETSLNVLLYWHRSTEETVGDHLPPFFSLRRNRFGPGWRLAVLGLEPLVPVSLFRQRHSPEGSRGFLFPLYDYKRQGSDSSLSIGGLSEISLYRRRKTAERIWHRIFPIYGYREERDTGEWSLGVFGIPPLSFYHHRSGPSGTRDRLFPIYRYASDLQAGTSRLNVLGFREFSLYQHVTSPTGIKDRLVPFYDYQHDREKRETRFNALLIARYRSSPSEMKISLLPFFSYERDENRDESRIGLLGVAPISLYQRLKTTELVSDRFFPIYNYSYDRNTQVGRFSVFWPLFNRKSLKGEVTELSVLWWLMRYERPEEGHKEFRVLGGSAIAMLRWKVTPDRTHFEFNPLIPFYAYEAVQGRGVRWDFLGGLIGQETNEEGDKEMRWFWFF